jgi:hypothetical protein
MIGEFASEDATVAELQDEADKQPQDPVRAEIRKAIGELIEARMDCQIEDPNTAEARINIAIDHLSNALMYSAMG